MRVEERIAFLLGNFTLTLFVIGLIFSGLELARTEKPLTGPVVARSLRTGNAGVIFWSDNLIPLVGLIGKTGDSSF